MGLIPKETVDQIMQTADIVEVVGEYVQLKRKGTTYAACCPFHNEKTPSFYVTPARGIFKCFGCGKAGDAVRFVMEIDGISYPEALRHLAGDEVVQGLDRGHRDQAVEQRDVAANRAHRGRTGEVG